MLRTTDHAQSFLQSLAAQFPEQGLRLVGSGNICQGIQVEGQWQRFAQPDDYEEHIGALPVWVAASLCRQVHALALDIESTTQGAVLLVTPEYPNCECASQQCHGRSSSAKTATTE